MIKRLFIISTFIFLGIVASFAQDYIAGIKGTQVWTRSELGSVPGYGIMIQNNEDNSVGLQIIAFKDGHFDIESSPLGIYMSDNGTVLINETTLPTFNVGGNTYKNVHYTKHKAKMKGVFANIEVWQLNNNDIEYSIIAIAPVKKNQVVKDFITNNLTLLPLPEVTEDSFIQSVESVNAMMQKAGGAKMSDEIKMTSAVVDKDSKEFIRTYQFYPDVSSEDVDELTTNDATYSMVEYEIENTPLVKNAVALGYSIMVVWNDKDGELIVSYKYDF